MKMRLFAAYRARPLHLPVMLVCFALAGYAGRHLLTEFPVRVATWFMGAAVAHDLLLLPAYVVADRALVALSRRHAHLRGVSWLNYVRIPTALSLLLLLVFLPSVFRLSPVYRQTTALSNAPYLGHWLLVSATMCVVSAVLLALATLRQSRKRT